MKQQIQKLKTLAFAFQSASSLLRNIPDRVGVIYRPIYEENALTPETLPLNREEEILQNFMAIILERGIKLDYSNHTYWDSGLTYDPIEVFGATVQSVDLHDVPLPKSVLPPQQDVAKFIQEVKFIPRKVLVHEQFSIALDITNNNVLGAVNLCWIATRFMGRGADQRAYPLVHMNAQEVRSWNNEVAQFETYNNSGKNDAPGDTYYFWTHVFGAMIFSDPSLEAKLAQCAFSRGTQIMKFVRKHIARKQPNITAHQPASAVGREVGLSFAYQKDHFE